ncbi:MAG: SAM-dependent methyltransferase [Citromicrobium sp.]|nr:SAM-dependent methyltransferase [Citromicrobium sp.]
MTPSEFIKKWRAVELKERTASQSHFNDICRLLEIEDPITADPKGEWFTFEKGAAKTGGGDGWADVWRKECFAWEYKGKKKDLDRAFAQLQQYAIALDNPPLLIVSDMDRFRIHTNWTNTVQEVHEFALDDLLDGATRDLLRNCFVNPAKLKPAKTRQMLTEEAAKEFSQLAQRLRERGNDAHAVAHFVNRLVFCMFAEDVGLLPNAMFQRMLEINRHSPDDFVEDAAALFRAMKSGGKVGFEKVEWFNGGLFDDDSVLPLEQDDIENLIAAAKLYWDEIDPSILGTLFERGLDPDKRSQLGAHYTDRDKILQIVEPVIKRPLMAEWAEVRSKIEQAIAKADKAKGGTKTKAENEAKKLQAEWHERLRNFRVLAPACGSGNFLYLSLLALKDIEHFTNLEAEAISPSLAAQFPTSGPENVLGIELNPYAAELARVSIWIGEIQWMRRNGFEAAKNPILRSLGNIENRDAVLVTDEDGSPVLDADGKPQRAQWPEADVVVGNPPFLGSKFHRKGRPATKTKPIMKGLGDEYTNALYAAYKGIVPSSADLVSYWFAQANAAFENRKSILFGLIATKSIGKGKSNVPLADLLRDRGLSIYLAWRNVPWVVDGAAVRVALICAASEPADMILDGAPVSSINADLSSGLDISASCPLSQNRKTAFQGVKLNGPFEITSEEARTLLTAPSNPNGQKNGRIIKRFVGNDDVTMRDADGWVVDFTDFEALEDACLFENPFQLVQERVSVHRENLAIGQATETAKLDQFWLMQRSRPKLRAATSLLERVIAVPETSEHLLFRFLPSASVFSGSLFAIARSDFTTFGVLSSSIHETWCEAQGNRLGAGNQGRYNATRTFATFPFPEGLTPDILAADYGHDPRAQAIAAAAERLNELRENWLNPPDLVERVPEVVEGYPDRILPKDDAAAKELKKRTLTNLYNARPAWLDHAHRALDEAVANAYGWGDLFKDKASPDALPEWIDGAEDEILARLFRLNQERAEAEASA